MYFKKLELIGFKSFMDKTVLQFEPGVTAIVGPNGCGKSNIFDSIRWVLGEQSVKSLRGSQMEDVIFNGTDTKQPLSMAEVSLTFDNENKFFSLDSNEVTVTRRIFRSGESEYFLNKASVRLKDILELLMGTGIGAESYSLVAQGKIDLILSSRPEDRRMVFDEASGITKYKAQKKEALRRLEETEQNLLRAGDIIAEVKRSIGYLERQANKARKYKDLYEVLKAKELSLAAIQKNNLCAQKQELANQLAVLKQQEQELTDKIKGYEQSVEERNEELKSRQGAIQALKDKLSILENGISRDTQLMQFNRQRIEELRTSRGYAQTQIETLQARLAQDEEQLRKVKAEELAIKKNIEEKSLLLRDNERLLHEIIVSTKSSTETIALAKKNILEIATSVTQVKNETVDLNSKKQIFLARKKRLDLEKAKAHEEKAVVEEDLAGLAAHLTQIKEVLSALCASIASVDNELAQGQGDLKQQTMDLENVEHQKLTLESHKEFLEKLQTQYESIDTSMNAVIFLDSVPQENISGLVIKVHNQFEEPQQDAQPQNRATIKLAGEAKPIDLDARRVTEKIAQIKEAIASLQEKKSVQEGLIEELNRKLLVLKQSAQEQEMALSNKNTSYQSVLQQCNKLTEEEEIIALELAEVRQELVTVDERLISLDAQFCELDRENKAQESLIHSEQENMAANTGRKEEILVVIAQTKAELESYTKRLNSEDSTVRMLEDAFRQNQENLIDLKKRNDESTLKCESLEAENMGLENKTAQDRLHIRGQADALQEEEARFVKIAESLSASVKQIEGQRQEMDHFKDKAYALQMDEKDLDFKYQSLKERISQVYKIDLESLAQDAPAAVLAPSDAVASLVSGLEDENTLTQEIQTMKDKLNSYGTVNLVAIEEYDELKKRYDFLTQQHTDLLTAKASLQEVIQKINRTTRKLFIETFEKVAEEFRNYFRLLFNGGDAKVYLLDEQDPLESGIEIICRPPGKKLQNVLLLSGGEKSLSAIALIFAIFKVKPAPFCILDEIDAALDEANVDRFSRMFQEFTNTSQFIVITHNKRTIANANVMYGITMIESGVSKIVSVKFAEKQPAKEESTQPVAA